MTGTADPLRYIPLLHVNVENLENSETTVIEQAESSTRHIAGSLGLTQNFIGIATDCLLINDNVYKHDITEMLKIYSNMAEETTVFQKFYNKMSAIFRVGK